MTTPDNCQQCRHHWSNFAPEDRDPGHCYMFEEYQPGCVLWMGGDPLIQDARDPLLPWLVLAFTEKDGET